MTTGKLNQSGRRRQDPHRRVYATGRSRREPSQTERDPARVVAFSDAVIAIAVTLLVLEIRPPQDTRHLLHGLPAPWPSYVSYVITFMLIGQVWANHHVMFDHIRHADRLVLFLNTVLLMDIAFLPLPPRSWPIRFATDRGSAPPSSFVALCSNWQPSCSTPSGGTPGMAAGYSPAT